MVKLNQKIPTLFGILVILLFAILTGLGVMIYGHWLLENETDQVLGDSLNWNVYQNENLGFSVSYPLDWIVKEDPPNGKVNFGQEKEVKTEDPRGENIENIKIFKAGFSVKRYPARRNLPGNEIKNLSLNEWIAEIFYPLERGEKKEPINAGIENYPGILIKKSNSFETEKLLTIIFFQSRETIYEIQGEAPSLNVIEFSADYETIFQSMLSTLKIFQFEGGSVKIARNKY